MTSRRNTIARTLRRARPVARTSALALGFVALAALPTAAQFSWPWDEPEVRRPVEQPAPAWRPPPEPSARPGVPSPGAGGRSPVCLQLEQRLVQETQAGGQSRDLIPMVEGQLRQVDQQLRQGNQTLDRSCYEYFLFSKTLRNTRKCVDLSREVEGLKRQKVDLENQRNQLIASTGRSYTDEIVRELARNNCGASYQQQARRTEMNPFQSLWQEDSGGSGGGGLGSSFSNLPYATYRTVCVRLCDGYYFPVSFSTLPNHFERDAEVCSSKCAAPTELFYYQNPGGSVEQMVGAQTNTPYTSMKTAFRYRKEYVQGCSCKVEEYNAGTPGAVDGAQQQGAVAPPAGAPALPTPAPPSTATAGDVGGWSSETVTP
jgi:hypothetical protein